LIKNTFTNFDAVLPMYFPRLLFKLLREKDISESLLLKGTQLMAKNFDDENFRMSFEQHSRFIRQAIVLSDNPHLGIEFGQQINMTSLGILGYAAMSCPNVTSCLETIIRYFFIRAPLIQLSFVEQQTAILKDSEVVALQIDEALHFNDLQYFMLTSTMCGTEHLLAFYTGQTQVIVHADLACEKPDNWEQVASQLNFTVAFSQPFTRLYFPQGLLSTRLSMADAQTESSAKLVCEQLMERMGIEDGIVNKVRQYILAQQFSFPSLVEAADHFCVSERTLRRELRKAGTSYLKILNKVRENIAIEYLLSSQKSIYDIALLMDTDISNFGRAFKQWTGKSPSQYKHMAR